MRTFLPNAKRILKRVIPSPIQSWLRPPAPPSPPAFLQSYAQEGEDMVLRRLFETRTTPGFFVDVGAHHPTLFSNTYYFYLQGWRGINIDAMPGSMKPFSSMRPGDINIEAAISAKPQELTYYVFNEPALNGFDPELSAFRDKLKDYHIVDQIKIQTRMLSEILDQNLAPKTEIDFLTVDVEGFDLQVLESNNWKKYRPTLVLAEDTGARSGWEYIQDSPVCRFLKEQSYSPFASTGLTVFYKKQD